MEIIRISDSRRAQCFLPFLILKIVSGRDTERHGFIMEFITGVAKKDTLEISEILAGDYEGKTIKVNGYMQLTKSEW